jgi:hypothetical protein
MGRCKFACCLVLMWYISEFVKNWFLFLIINKRWERMYKGKIYNLVDVGISTPLATVKQSGYLMVSMVDDEITSCVKYCRII